MSAKQTSYDIIIAGAGAAGLNLALALQDADFEGSILLVDQSLSSAHNKTWCYWSEQSYFPDELFSKIWENITVKKSDSEFRDSALPWKYFCLSGKRFQEYALGKLSGYSNITILETEIQKLYSKAESVILETHDGHFEAKAAYQSIHQPADLYEASRYKLKQHFTGWEIKTLKDVFNPDEMVLMDFDVPQLGGLTFFYALPFTKRTALIEHTLFTPEILTDNQYKAALQNYISERYQLGIDEYEITRSEFGVIPMVEQKIPVTEDGLIFNIGTAGGATKPSTGYTFARSVRRTRKIAHHIIQKKSHRITPEISNFRYRYYDLLILHLIAHQPETAVKILADLFAKNGYQTVFSFLSEDTDFADDVRVMNSCPHVPFLKAIWHTKDLIFRI